MKKVKNNNLRQVLCYFKPHKLLIILIFVLGLLFSLFGIIEPIISAKLLVYVTAIDYKNILLFALLLLGINILLMFFHYIYNIIFIKLRSIVVANIRKDMVLNVLKMQIKNFDTHSSGLFNERISSEPNTLVSSFDLVQVRIFSIISGVGVFAYIFYLSWQIGFLSVLFFVFLYFYETYYMKLITEKREKYRDGRENASTVINELVRGIREIKTLNLGKMFTNYVNKSIVTIQKNEEDVKMANTKYWNINDIVNHIYNFLLIVLGVYLVYLKKLSITNFIVIYMYRYHVVNLSYYVSAFRDSFNDFKISANRIFEFLDVKKYPIEVFGRKKLDKLKGKIEFKNVYFSYNKENGVLNDLSITIKPKEMVAIVGASGSGKSTILNLIAKLYKVNDGKILLDGININQLNVDSIRDNIAMINQNPYIFNMSIKENLLLVKEDATDEEIVDACTKACINDYIESLPDKYDSLLGEGGINLSGGQKQRIAIARAFLKNSKVVLFDEATSALDNQTQFRIQEAIDKLNETSTVVIVAHRLTTIKNCDIIYVLDDGKIIDSGKHYDLLKNCSLYKKLYESDILK